jgi:hypothetical protein
MHADQDDVIASALAAGCTQQEAAAKAGVSRPTVARRVADPEFQKRVTYFRRQAIGETLGLLMKAGPDAVAALALIAEGGEKDSDRIKAADRILEITLKIQASIDYEERLRTVEAQLGIGTAQPATGQPTGEGGSTSQPPSVGPGADHTPGDRPTGQPAKRPDAPHAGDGHATGPVAGGSDHVPGAADRGAVHEAVGEDGVHGVAGDGAVPDATDTGFDLRPD